MADGNGGRELLDGHEGIRAVEGQIPEQAVVMGLPSVTGGAQQRQGARREEISMQKCTLCGELRTTWHILGGVQSTCSRMNRLDGKC